MYVKTHEAVFFPRILHMTHTTWNGAINFAIRALQPSQDTRFGALELGDCMHLMDILITRFDLLST